MFYKLQDAISDLIDMLHTELYDYFLANRFLYKTADKRQVLIESLRSSGCCARYFKEIQQFQGQIVPIVYLDEKRQQT